MELEKLRRLRYRQDYPLHLFLAAVSGWEEALAPVRQTRWSGGYEARTVRPRAGGWRRICAHCGRRVRSGRTGAWGKAR